MARQMLIFLYNRQKNNCANNYTYMVNMIMKMMYDAFILAYICIWPKKEIFNEQKILKTVKTYFLKWRQNIIYILVLFYLMRMSFIYFSLEIFISQSLLRCFHGLIKYTRWFGIYHSIQSLFSWKSFLCSCSDKFIYWWCWWYFLGCLCKFLLLF